MKWLNEMELQTIYFYALVRLNSYESETNVWFIRKIPEIGPEMIPQIVRLKHQAYVLGQQDYYFIKGYQKSCQHCVLQTKLGY